MQGGLRESGHERAAPSTAGVSAGIDVQVLPTFSRDTSSPVARAPTGMGYGNDLNGAGQFPVDHQVGIMSQAVHSSAVEVRAPLSGCGGNLGDGFIQLVHETVGHQGTVLSVPPAGGTRLIDSPRMKVNGRWTHRRLP